jgi:hypothetical protein
MEPTDGLAVCPTCGRTDTAAALQPLFVVTGASGSGKTTIFVPLAKLLVSRCATFDVDWLLDAAGALSGARTVAEIPWEGFLQAWLSVAHGVAQSGLPTLLLGPVVPERLMPNPARKWVGEIHSLVLDCPDEIANESKTVHPGDFVTSMNRLLSDAGCGRTFPTKLTPRSVPRTKRPR